MPKPKADSDWRSYARRRRVPSSPSASSQNSPSRPSGQPRVIHISCGARECAGVSPVHPPSSRPAHCPHARTAAGSVHWVFNCRYRSARLRSSRALFIGHLAAETVTRLWGCGLRGALSQTGVLRVRTLYLQRTSSSDWQVPKDNCIHDAHEEDRPISERSSGRDLVSTVLRLRRMVRILLIYLA